MFIKWLCSVLVRFLYPALKEMADRATVVKVIRYENHLPVRFHDGDAGFDLPCSRGGYIMPGEMVVIETGIAFAIPMGMHGVVRPRSGMSQRGIECVTGTIDSGYRNSVRLIVWNNSPRRFLYQAGDRLAQIVFLEQPNVKLVYDEKSNQAVDGRGLNGFGSTGTVTGMNAPKVSSASRQSVVTP
jgi:dUTP pyrophosphatase